MEATPRSNRLHIAICGRRNAGKSSLINALTNQEIAMVSTVPGTTTDPVYKAMEILPVGPVMLVDTAGIDDTGELGSLRVKRSYDVLSTADMVVLVIDAATGVTSYERELAGRCRADGLPLIVVLNKTDLIGTSADRVAEIMRELDIDPVPVSTKTGQGINKLKLALIEKAPDHWDEQPIVGDLLNAGDTAVLVAPIDKAAPKGRLILPQVQTIRDVLDHRGMAYVVTDEELPACLTGLAPRPKIVITDSQVFGKVDQATPKDILLTSFSILFARQKGDLTTLVAGAGMIRHLEPGDKVLIAEACTHHRVEDDIGSVKIPRWLTHYVGGNLDFRWSSGRGFPEDLAEYKLVIHCGACMLTRREMLGRLAEVQAAGVPVVNYGVCIAYLHGILARALSPFPDLKERFDIGNHTGGRSQTPMPQGGITNE